MAYFTTSKLLNYKNDPSVVRLAQKHSATRVAASMKVFLSHSHQDRDYVEAVRLLLESQGSGIYVDWQDGEMPAQTSWQTAASLKSKIKDLKKVVLLASENSKESKWVPWELGYGEGVNGLSSVAILAVLPDNVELWKGTEYVSAYPFIEEDQRGPIVRNPVDGTTQLLTDWLRK